MPERYSAQLNRAIPRPVQRLDPHAGPLLEPTPRGVGWLELNTNLPGKGF